MEVDNSKRLWHSVQLRMNGHPSSQFHFFASRVKPLQKLFIIVHQECVIICLIQLAFAISRLLPFHHSLPASQAIRHHCRLIQLGSWPEESRFLATLLSSLII